MSNRYATGKIANGICDRCGFEYRLKELRHEVVKGNVTNLKVCSSCWDADHPQLHLGEYPVDDPQAIRDPRPDYGELGESRAQIIPATQMVSFGRVGHFTVTTT